MMKQMYCSKYWQVGNGERETLAYHKDEILHGGVVMPLNWQWGSS